VVVYLYKGVFSYCILQIQIRFGFAPEDIRFSVAYVSHTARFYRLIKKWL
jgi:hypothetical protein